LKWFEKKGGKKVIREGMGPGPWVREREERKGGSGRFLWQTRSSSAIPSTRQADPVSNCFFLSSSFFLLFDAVASNPFDLSTPLHGLPPSGEPGLFTAMHFVSPRPSDDGSSASQPQRTSTKSPPKTKIPKKALRRGGGSFLLLLFLLPVCLFLFCFGV